MSSNIVHGFSKKMHYSSTQKFFFQNHFLFFFVTSLFISTYGFNQTFWLNLMPLCFFFNSNLGLNVCFKFFMSRTCSSFPCKFVPRLSNFPNFILSRKKNCEGFRQKGNHCEGYINFQSAEKISFKKISFITLIIIVFYEILFK